MKFVVETEVNLLDLLGIKIPTASKTTLRDMIKQKRISVNGSAVIKTDTVVFPTQIVEVGDKKKPPNRVEADFNVLFEDEFIIVAEKPAGMLTISTDKEKENTFYRLVSDYVIENSRGKTRVFVIHRLDKEVSGLLLFAKSEEIQERIQNDWANTEKVYYALVEGHLEKKEGTIKSYLKENTVGKVYSTDSKFESFYSITHYKVLKKNKEVSLLELKLETGRKHQIRVHLSDLGNPVLGDKKYGNKELSLSRIGLHAFSLTFKHPLTEEVMKLETKLPAEFEKYIRWMDQEMK